MATERTLRGTVRPSVNDAGGLATRVVVTRGESVVAEAPVRPDGGFAVQIPEVPGLVITLIGRDGRALRSRLGGASKADVDLGEVGLAAEEFPAGIAGQAWDVLDDRPVAGGMAQLVRHDAVIAAERLDSSGQFAFELGENNPLPAGTYRVVVEATGYLPGERVVDVSDDVASYRIGRVELAPAANG